jgi:DNA-binding response OmpR family regulator
MLDLGLPDGNGLDLLARWRRANLDTPMLILSTKHALEDKITSLNLGADD